MGRRKKLVIWSDVEHKNRAGCTFWLSTGQRYMIVRSDQAYGTPLPTIWTVWHKAYKPGLPKAIFRKIMETRSKKRAFDFAETYQRKLMEPG